MYNFDVNNKLGAYFNIINWICFLITLAKIVIRPITWEEIRNKSLMETIDDFVPIKR